MANEIQNTEGQMTMSQFVTSLSTNVLSEIESKQQHGLVIPKGYNVQNALTLALFQIKGTVDKDGKSVLTACTQDSVKQALVEMVTKGLQPEKKHCYWIAYADKLSCTESYFGLKYRAKRADPNIKDIFAEIVYEKDTFTYIIKHGTKVVTDHLQAPENIDITKIRGAYCTILYRDGNEVSEYMTIQQIRNSWAKTKNRSGADAEIFILYPEQMAKRTVTKRLCNSVVNTETNDLLLSDIEETIDSNADEYEATEMIDITPIESTPEVVKEIETVEVKPVVKEPKKAKTTTATMNLDEVPSLT